MPLHMWLQALLSVNVLNAPGAKVKPRRGLSEAAVMLFANFDQKRICIGRMRGRRGGHIYI